MYSCLEVDNYNAIGNVLERHCFHTLQKASLREKFTVMNLKLDDFTAWAIRVCGKSPARQLGEYIATNRGKNLDAVVEECLKDNSLKSYVSKFAQVVNEVSRRNISKASVSLALETGKLGENPSTEAMDFKRQCKQELIKKALDENIPVAKRQYIGSQARSLSFTDRFLDVKGLNEAQETKEYFRWINCVAEFHCGEPLFHYEREENQQAIVSDTESSSKNIEDNRITLEKLAEQEQAENLLYELWEKGFLQCDLSR